MSDPQQPAGGAEERLPTADEALLSSVHLLITIGFEATGLRPGSSRDPAECQRAIDGVRALLPLLEGALPADAYREYRQALADLQMAYAEAVKPPSAPAEASPAPEPATPERPKIWTPRGDV